MNKIRTINCALLVCEDGDVDFGTKVLSYISQCSITFESSKFQEIDHPKFQFHDPFWDDFILA